MQWVQILRTSRWARMPSTELETRNGSTPMSSNRVVAPAESLVCRVLNTKWPVSEALMATSAVSRSRISPTRITSGSCRRKARRAREKLSPIFSLVCT